MRQRRLRQEPLDLGEPCGVDALGFAVRDARRQVAIADHHRARVEPRRDARPELESIGDVEQLQRVRLVVALALQRAADLRADRASCIRERSGTRRCGRAVETPSSSRSAWVCLPL